MSTRLPDLGRLRMDLESFVVAEGLAQVSIALLLQGFADRLLAGGVPLSRAYIALPTISPDTRAMSVTWRRDGVSSDGVEHERYSGAFDASPVAFMLREGIGARRWRLSDPEGCERYELLEELRAQGDTDYLAHLVSFGGGEAPTALRGVVLSVCTDQEEGFSSLRPACWRTLPRFSPSRPTASRSSTSRLTCSGPMSGAMPAAAC